MLPVGSSLLARQLLQTPLGRRTLFTTRKNRPPFGNISAKWFYVGIPVMGYIYLGLLQSYPASEILPCDPYLREIELKKRAEKQKKSE